MLVLRALLAVMLVSAACSPARRAPRGPVAVEPATSSPPPASPAWPMERNAQFPFEVLDVSVVEAAEHFRRETGRSMVVDAEAMSLARCVRISVEVPAGWRIEQVVDAIELAMVTSGLGIARRDDAYVIFAGPKVPEALRRRCGPER